MNLPPLTVQLVTSKLPEDQPGHQASVFLFERGAREVVGSERGPRGVVGDGKKQTPGLKPVLIICAFLCACRQNQDGGLHGNPAFTQRSFAPWFR